MAVEDSVIQTAVLPDAKRVSHCYFLAVGSFWAQNMPSRAHCGTYSAITLVIMRFQGNWLNNLNFR